MIGKFLSQTQFSSQEDFIRNLKINIPDNFNFGYDIVDGWAAEEPDRKAMLWTNDKGECRQFTFGDMKRFSDMTASWFQSLGIGRGDKVMLILKRRYEFWFSIIALHKIGAVAIPATHLLTKKDIVYRCKAATIKAIVAAGEGEILKHISDARPDCPGLETVISTGPEYPEGFLDFHKGIESAGPFSRPAEVNTNDDIMLMYFTSGTTGEPKMVAHDFTYPLGHIVTACYWHNLHRESLHFTIADTGWAKAAWGKIYGQMIAGANIFVYDHVKFTPADILKKIHDYRITSLCAPPTIYRFLIREDLSKYDLSSLEYCTTAGEALNYSVYETFLKITGIRLMEGFGQTETTLTLGTFPWMNPKPGSMGVPNPQYDIDLLKPDGRPAEDGEQGQIVIRTDKGKPVGLFKEYYRDPEMTAKSWHDGCYYTGDLAWRGRRRLLLVCRKGGRCHKEFRLPHRSFRGGKRADDPSGSRRMRNHRCSGRNQRPGGEGHDNPVQRIQEKAGPELVKELQDHVKKVTAPYKYPRVIEFVDELPKTISGKIRRVDIREKDSK